METILTAPDSLLGWITLVGFVFLGAVAAWGQWRKASQANEKEADDASDRVIKLLKEQVDALEKKVDEQETLLKETKQRLDTLISENKLLREVLQGRDAATVAFQGRVLDAITFHQQTAQTVSNINENVQKLINTTMVEEKTTRKVSKI